MGRLLGWGCVNAVRKFVSSCNPCDDSPLLVRIGRGRRECCSRRSTSDTGDCRYRDSCPGRQRGARRDCNGRIADAGPQQRGTSGVYCSAHGHRRGQRRTILECSVRASSSISQIARAGQACAERHRQFHFYYDVRRRAERCRAGCFSFPFSRGRTFDERFRPRLSVMELPFKPSSGQVSPRRMATEFLHLPIYPHR